MYPYLCTERNTKDILATQFGVSPRTAAMEANIGSNLIDEGMNLYDSGDITKTDAECDTGLYEKGTTLRQSLLGYSA